LPNLINIARGIKRSTAFQNVVATPKRLAIARHQRANRGIFSIEIEANAGLFAVMQLVLFVLVHCEKHRLFPDISAKGGLYGEHTGTVDWFGMMFERTKVPDAAVRDRLSTRANIHTSRIKGVYELGFRERYERELSLAMASALFTRYYRVSRDIEASVDHFFSGIGPTQETLAVHYRGTDKIYEADRVPWDVMCSAVQQAVRDRPFLRRILVASDETRFIEFCRGYAFSLPVVATPAQYMPRGEKPVHFSGHPGVEIAREALVTCVMLSRCGFLIKTASYLSAWSKILNPELPVWLVAPPIGGGFFPDRVLWHDQEAGIVRFGDKA
jgi:hypothetical protein